MIIKDKLQKIPIPKNLSRRVEYDVMDNIHREELIWRKGIITLVVAAVMIVVSLLLIESPGRTTNFHSDDRRLSVSSIIITEEVTAIWLETLTDKNGG